MYTIWNEWQALVLVQRPGEHNTQASLISWNVLPASHTLTVFCIQGALEWVPIEQEPNQIGSSPHPEPGPSGRGRQRSDSNSGQAGHAEHKHHLKVGHLPQNTLMCMQAKTQQM